MTDTSKELPELLPCPFCGGDAGDTYYQLGWFISCKHCSASTEVTNAKARAVEAWNRRAPAVPVPQFNHTAKRKLNILLGAGEEITGYAFQNKDGRRGSIDCHGFVAWWQDAAAPQPPEAALVPSIAVTPEMVEAANEAYCPFGDMELALCAALQVAPKPPEAAPVELPEPVYTMRVRGRMHDYTPTLSAFDLADGEHKLYTEQQVRQLLNAHGIQEQST